MTGKKAEPEAAAVWVPISELTPWDRNPRKNDGEPVEAVKRSIQRFGFGAPIIARKADGEIIAGHTRLKAAQALGLEKVPVRYMDLDPADAHLYALADNRLNEKAEWDTPELLNLLGEFGLNDAELAGWNQADLDKFTSELATPDFLPGTEDEQGRLDQKKPVTCPACAHEFTI